jgi:hypothetical protein
MYIIKNSNNYRNAIFKSKEGIRRQFVLAAMLFKLGRTFLYGI